MHDCYLCNSQNVSDVMAYRSLPGEELFRSRRIVRCGNCGLLQVDRRFSAAELDEYYRSSYNRAEIFGLDVARFPRDNLWAVSRGRALAKLLRAHVPMRPGITVVDVGCAYGHLLFGFTQHVDCSAVIGIDYDKEAEKLFERNGWSFRLGGIEQHAEDLRGKVDVLITSHVLEHVTDPVGFLKICGGMLSDRGVLLWEVPNCDEFGSRCERRHSPHICFWDIHSLRKVVTNCGYQFIFLDHAGPAYGRLDQQSTAHRWLRRIARRFQRDRLLEVSTADKDSVGFDLDRYGGERRRNLRLIAIRVAGDQTPAI